MEENETRIEENLINSIGSNEEITEPHVKQIIAAFDGKKLTKEDIDKFKQLETVFREIAKLEDGETVLRNLTGDITETIVSKASYQTETGIVSVGEIANIAISMSEKAYKDKQDAEKQKDEKKTLGDAIEEARRRGKSEEGKLESKLNPEKHSKFTKDLMNFMEGLGINLSDEQRAYFENDMRSLADIVKNNPNDKEAKELYESEKACHEDESVENRRRHARALYNYYHKKFIGAQERLKNFEYNQNGIDYQQTKEELESLKEILKAVGEYRDKVERGEVVALFGASPEKIQELVEIEEEQEKLRQEGKSENNSKEYKELSRKKENLLRTYELEGINQEIEELKKEILLADDGNSELFQKKNKLTELVAKKWAILNQNRNSSLIDNSNIHETHIDEKNVNNTILVDEKRIEEAQKYAKMVNDSYLKTEGRLTILETVSNRYGRLKNPIEKEDPLRETVIHYQNLFSRILSGLRIELSKARSEEEKINIYEKINTHKTELNRKLAELGIPVNHRIVISNEFFLEKMDMTPTDYQEMMWDVALHKAKEKGDLKKQKEISEKKDRFRNNRSVYNELNAALIENETALENQELILEAIRKTIMNNPNIKKDLSKAATEEDVLNILLKEYDNQFADNQDYTGEVRDAFESVMYKTMVFMPKDCILAMAENHIATESYMLDIERSMNFERVIRTFRKDKDKDKDKEKVIVGGINKPLENKKGYLPYFLIQSDDNELPMNNLECLEYMLSQRKKGVDESTIYRQLTQIHPDAARNAYALYELGINKKALSNPQIDNKEKESIRQRNAQIVNMLRGQYEMNLLKKARSYGDRIEKGEFGQTMLSRLQEACLKKVSVSMDQEDFNIEDCIFELPDEVQQVRESSETTSFGEARQTIDDNENYTPIRIENIQKKAEQAQFREVVEQTETIKGAVIEQVNKKDNQAKATKDGEEVSL